MKGKIVRFLFFVFSFMLLCSFISVLTESVKEYKDKNLFQELASKTTKVVPEEIHQEISSEVSDTEDFNEPLLSSNSVDSEISDSLKNNVSESQQDEASNHTILPEYQELYSQNPDLYGWIKIDDSYINYPVMYSPNDLEYYLRKNFYKEYSIIGTPFVEFPDAENVIIFGHNMQDNSMFSTLVDYKDINYWKTHKYIHFDTLYEKNVYEIIIVASATAYYDVSKIPDDEYLFYEHCYLNSEQDFEDYLFNVKKTEYFDSGISANYGDSLITLCTCDYIGQDSRLIIVAKKI